jgi:hypothetical protein
VSSEPPSGPDPDRGVTPEPDDPWAAPPPAPPPRRSVRPSPPPDPWAVAINTGGPASVPPGSAPWEPYPDQLARARSLPSTPRPQWGDPDPAAVSGPPWPILVAAGGYTPPRLIRWPIVAGLAALVVYLVVFFALSGAGNPGSQAGWRDQHAPTIEVLAHDEAALAASYSPTVVAARRLAAWRKFRADVVAAAELPNPGDGATAPWREMLNDYANAATDVIGAMTGPRRNQEADLADAQRDLLAGVQAGHRFDQAVGIGGR